MCLVSPFPSPRALRCIHFPLLFQGFVRPSRPFPPQSSRGLLMRLSLTSALFPLDEWTALGSVAEAAGHEWRCFGVGLYESGSGGCGARGDAPSARGRLLVGPDYPGAATLPALVASLSPIAAPLWPWWRAASQSQHLRPPPRGGEADSGA